MRSALSTILLVLIHSIYGQVDFERGEALIESSEYESARVYFQHHLDSCEVVCPDTTVALLHIHLGRTLKLSNKNDSALMNFMAGIELFAESDHFDGQTFGLVSLAELYRSIQEFEKALACLKQVEDIRSIHQLSPQNLAYFYNRYAAVLNETTGDYSQVLDYSNKVLEIAVAIKDKDLEASSLNELGYLYEKMKDPTAIGYFQKAYEIYYAEGNLRYATSILSNLARSSFLFEQYDQSLVYAKEGLRLCEGKEWVKAMPELYFVLYKNYVQFDQKDQALIAYENYHRTFLEAREVEWNESLYQIEAKFDLAEKERQLAEVKHSEDLVRIESQQKSRQLNYLLVVGLLLSIITGLLLWAYRRTKRINHLLNDSLKQKEILRQEVHHRVKNNLTFLKSLLYLRSNASDDQDVKLILDECQSRIQAMALVHQNLYDTDDASEVDFKVFLEKLFLELESMFHQDQSNIDLNLNIDQLKIDMKMSVFVGLILNEMITNSLKYAFVNGEQGKIDISLNDIGEQFELSYSDNGEGLPSNFDIQTSNGFGFKLINILVNQINAKMHYEQNGMSTFRIMIPK